MNLIIFVEEKTNYNFKKSFFNIIRKPSAFVCLFSVFVYSESLFGSLGEYHHILGSCAGVWVSTVCVQCCLSLCCCRRRWSSFVSVAFVFFTSHVIPAFLLFVSFLLSFFICSIVIRSQYLSQSLRHILFLFPHTHTHTRLHTHAYHFRMQMCCTCPVFSSFFRHNLRMSDYLWARC